MKTSPLYKMMIFGIGGLFLLSLSCYTQFSSSRVHKNNDVGYDTYEDEVDDAVELNSYSEGEAADDYVEVDRGYGLSGAALYPESIQPEGIGSGEIRLDPVYYEVSPPPVIISPYVYYPNWYYWRPHYSEFSMHFGFGWGTWFGFSYYDWDPWWNMPYYPYCYGFYDIYYTPSWYYHGAYHRWHHPYYYGGSPWYYHGRNDYYRPDYKKRDFAKRGEASRRSARARGVVSSDGEKGSSVSKGSDGENSGTPGYSGGRREKRADPGGVSTAPKTGTSNTTAGTKSGSESGKGKSESTGRRTTTKREKSTSPKSNGKTGSSGTKRAEGKSKSRESASRGRSTSSSKPSTSGRSSSSRGKSSSSAGRSSSGGSRSSSGSSSKSSGSSSRGSGRRSSR